MLTTKMRSWKQKRLYKIQYISVYINCVIRYVLLKSKSWNMIHFDEYRGVEIYIYILCLLYTLYTCTLVVVHKCDF